MEFYAGLFIFLPNKLVDCLIAQRLFCLYNKNQKKYFYMQPVAAEQTKW